MVGYYVDSAGHFQGLLLSESLGTWGTGVEAAPPANAGSDPTATLGSVSCASAGNCAAVGAYTDTSGHEQGLLLSESSGTWGTGVEAALPANAGSNSQSGAFLGSVSCASAGNCAAVGYYFDSLVNRLGLLLDESSGTWGTGVEAAPPANAGSDPSVNLLSVSCASAGNCAAVGSYVDSAGHHQGALIGTGDTTAPTTTIALSPGSPNGTNGWYVGSVGVSVSASDPDDAVAQTRCVLDPASVPASFDDLPNASCSLSSVSTDGQHTIYAASEDSNGNKETPVVSASFKIDQTPPETQIDSGPSGQTNNASPSFAFSSEPGASFECKLDSGSYAACSSPKSYSSLAGGSHTFSVRATDQAGNTDPSPASRSFTVDTTPPETTIDSGPSGTTNDPTPTFAFSSSESSSFECKLDSGSYAACSSPITTAHLADGSHSLSVRATDFSGNTDATPATRTFIVQTAAVSVSGSTLVVTAAPGAKDNLVIAKPSASTLRVTDLASGTYTGSGVHTGSGCSPSGDRTANCSTSGITLIKVTARDQDDKVTNSTAIKGSLAGGAGNDLMSGGSVADTLIGGPGLDALKGMAGSDLLKARDSTSDTLIDCGSGSDEAELDLLPKDPNSVVKDCETKTRPPAPGPYVALGDSLSTGYAASSPAKGYVGLLNTGYQSSLGVNQLLDVGEPGASTTSLRDNGQLANALADINASSDTKAVTIDIGGYEALLGGPACPGHWDGPNCHVRANLAYILGQLKSALAADPGTEPFTAMAYYNPESRDGGTQESSTDTTLLGTDRAIGCSDTGAKVGLNDVIYQEAGKLGIPVADPYAAFKQHGQAYISQSDGFHPPIHPNDAGYAAIAKAFQSPTNKCGS